MLHSIKKKSPKEPKASSSKKNIKKPSIADIKVHKESNHHLISRQQNKSKGKKQINPGKKYQLEIPRTALNKKCKQKSKRKSKSKPKNTFTSLQIPEEVNHSQIQIEYKKSMRDSTSGIRWIIPNDQKLENNFKAFWDFVNPEDFLDLNNLTINFLHYTCKKRIIRDKDFNFIHEGLVKKFPQHKQAIQSMLSEVLNILDS